MDGSYVTTFCLLQLNGHDTRDYDHSTVLNIIHYATGTPLTLTVLSANTEGMSTQEKQNAWLQMHAKVVTAMDMCMYNVCLFVHPLGCLYNVFVKV